MEKFCRGGATTLAASRFAFQTVVVLEIQRLQLGSQSFVSFLIQMWCGHESSAKKYFWCSEHMHFDINIDDSPPKSIVFIIQCNELWSN